MAIIHISEAEAANDFERVMSKAFDGEEIVIDGSRGAVRLTKEVPAAQTAFAPLYSEPRLLSEIIADMKRNPSSATLDGGYSEHLEEVIRSHEHETLRNPWEAS
jgi:hypothetical protein